MTATIGFSTSARRGRISILWTCFVEQHAFVLADEFADALTAHEFAYAFGDGKRFGRRYFSDHTVVGFVKVRLRDKQSAAIKRVRLAQSVRHCTGCGVLCPKSA